VKPVNATLNKITQLTNYLFYSVVVALIDTSIVWVLVKFSVTSLIAANTIGVVSGFIIHYFLSSKAVFNTRYGVGGFAIYLVTFILGLILANALIFMCYEYMFSPYQMDLRILLSKAVSIVVPFFALYYLRLYMFARLNKKRKEVEDIAP
jgi:putative flippase GtrA